MGMNKLGVALMLLLLTSATILLVVAQGKREESPDNAVMTAKQREHSKHYKEYKNPNKIPDLIDIDPIGVRVGVGTPLGGSDPAASTPLSLTRFLKRHECRADAVVLGMISEESSHLTEGQNFVFTDYEMVVEEVIKNSTGTPIIQGNKITITRPGGKVQIRGKIAEAVDASFQPLQVGKRHLLFLKYIPESGDFKSADSRGSFLLDGQDQVKPLTGEYLGILPELLKESSLLSELRNDSTDGDCNQAAKEGH
jgi:hypothetical protein